MACKLGLNHLGLANPGMASCPQGKSRKGEEEGEEEEGNTEVEGILYVIGIPCPSVRAGWLAAM